MLVVTELAQPPLLPVQLLVHVKIFGKPKNAKSKRTRENVARKESRKNAKKLVNFAKCFLSSVSVTT